ncbi:MAG: peroxiredoxin [Trueperaceae bacterium]|nr:peroxiredoxin [Trueperaceae bacterium]
MPEVGEGAPAFEAHDAEGQVHSLERYAGSWVVLYFYPTDDTPGCTTQACGFRDSLASLQGVGAVVLGASGDDADAHRAFATKYDLDFPLLVDPEKSLLEAYEVWGEKKNFGRTYMGVIRTTFLIDPSGVIAHVWHTVNVEGHAEDVHAVIAELADRAA